MMWTFSRLGITGVPVLYSESQRLRFWLELCHAVGESMQLFRQLQCCTFVRTALASSICSCKNFQFCQVLATVYSYSYIVLHSFLISAIGCGY